MYYIKDKTTVDTWNSCPSLDTVHIAQAFLILPNFSPKYLRLISKLYNDTLMVAWMNDN